MKWIKFKPPLDVPERDRPVVAMDGGGTFRTLRYTLGERSPILEYDWSFEDGCNCCSRFNQDEIVKFAYLDEE